MPAGKPTCLYVCITCCGAAPRTAFEGRTVPGQVLFDAVSRLLRESDGRAVLQLAPVTCLASCERGCAAAISAPGKWTYLVGGLMPAQAADLLDYGAAYARSPTGFVGSSARPASLRDAILGRVPTLPTAEETIA